MPVADLSGGPDQGTLGAMKFTAADLAATLAASPEEGYVRMVTDWLVHGEVARAGPVLTGRPVVDALVAAGTAQLARLNKDRDTGPWTLELVTSIFTEDTLKEYSRPAATERVSLHSGALVSVP